MRRGINSMASGPLMSDHLEDLELELELLRRKRQLIQQQQQILTGDQSYNNERPYPNNQPHQAFDSDNLYFERSGSNSYGQRLGNKRQAPEPLWQNEFPSKRFARPPRTRGKKSGEDLIDYKPVSRRQDMGRNDSYSNWNLDFKRPPASFKNPSRHDNKPSKVIKSKLPYIPNKLNTYKTSERKQLVSATSGLVKKAGEDPNFILHPDKTPNAKLVGRLELALGHILKEMREKYGVDAKYAEHFLIPCKLKYIKKCIRDRVRELMLGKFVGQMLDIVKVYRDKYPPETDIQILNAPEMPHDEAVVKPEVEVAQKVQVPKEHPYVFIRRNLSDILTARVDNMFDKLKKLYTEEANITNVVECVNNTEETVSAEQQEPNQSNEEQTADNPEMKEQEKNDLKEEEKHKEESNKEDSKETANTDLNTDTDIEKGDVDTDIKNDEVVDDKVKDEISNDKIKEETDYHKSLDNIIKQRLGQMLPRYKHIVFSLLQNDKEFQNRIKELQKETLMLSKSSEDKDDKKQKLFHVKIIGKPYLPNRNLMKDFLKDFNPTTIKKHKVYNILFVGFTEKENYDKILAATGSSIGVCKLTISVSDRMNQKTKKDDSAVTEKNDELADVEEVKDNAEENSTAQNSDYISSDLDKQIDDLLTNIQSEEAQVQAVKDNDVIAVINDTPVIDISSDIEHGAEDNAKDKPEEVAKDKPEEVANDKPEEVANDKPEEVANDKPEEVANDVTMDSETTKTLDQPTEAINNGDKNGEATNEKPPATPKKSVKPAADEAPNTVVTRRTSSRRAQNN